MRTRTFLVFAMVVTICFALGATVAVAADPTVTRHGTDLSTNGEWVGTYGECFYLLPNSVRTGEDPLWDDNVCFGGSFVDEGRISWGLVAGEDQLPEHVYVWSLFGKTEEDGNAEQWNPCVGAYRGATFDNGDVHQVGTVYDPLTNILTINYEGCLTLSYYFLEPRRECRQLEYQLWVNGVSMGSDGAGDINDLSSGKYVVFEVCGLEEGDTIILDVENSYIESCEGTPPNYPNAHLSGVFVSDCEDGGGGYGCTPGFWKQKHHFDSWTDPPADPYTTMFSDVFSVVPSKGDLLLAEALAMGGGGEKALLRHASAAYLNAISPDVDYFFTAGEVIAMVQEAFGSGDFEAAKDMLEAENERGCPLN